MKITAELISLSRYFGKPAYVIAGGGNTSYKRGDKMWIKASGIPLAGIDEEGFVCLSRSELQKISTNKYSDDHVVREKQIKNDLLKARTGDINKRPSVETSLHNLIDFPLVVHTHPTSVNALLCSRGAETVTQELFGSDVLFLDYVNPGYELFKYAERKIKGYSDIYGRQPGIIFLRNHGLIVSGSSAGDIYSKTSSLIQAIEKKIKSGLPSTSGYSPGTSEDKILERLEKYMAEFDLVPLFRNNELIQYFVGDEEYFKNSVRPFTPDNVVYCKADYLFSGGDAHSIIANIGLFVEVKAYFPRVIAIEGKGIIAAAPDSSEAGKILDVFQDMLKVSLLSENFGGPCFLNGEQVQFIDNWEAENYRRSIR
jgi:rhamnose utilization protein RhaD (predicted bifunctional aldolase and dehydrogenase)